MEVIVELFSPIIALFKELGGIIFFPIIVLSFFIGINVKKYIKPPMNVFIFVLAVIIFYSWSFIFVANYKDSPTTSVHKIVGWGYLSTTQRYLEKFPQLYDLSAKKRNNILLSEFKGDPDLIWKGSGLAISRVVGSSAMALVLVCLGMLFPFAAKQAETT